MNRKFCYIWPLALLAGLAVASFNWRSDRITFRGYKEIRLGMALEEVENIVGKPGIYVSRQRLLETLVQRAGSFGVAIPKGMVAEGDYASTNESRVVDWIAESGTITVGLDEKGFVIWKSYMTLPERDLIDRLRDLLPD